jgi:uncharacterized phage protein (TIGR01671 family)
MRKIIFRGKTPDGEWVYGDLTTMFSIMVDDPSIIQDDNDIKYVTPESVGQFIGLTDKDGREIYEGDIITIGGKYPKLIRYIREYASFCVANLNDVGNEDEYDIWQQINDVWWGNRATRIKVAGNEHDNPEMLL